MILKGKVTIISGIGPGLGQELALACAREGAKLVVGARTAAKLDEIEAQIAATTPSCEVLKCATDIRDRAACDAMAAATLARFGRVDILINSAYIVGQYQRAAEADLDDWRNTLETNLFGSMNLIQAIIPAMRSVGGGSIVNVNTKVARMPLEDHGGYAVSKAALRMATTQLAKELGGDGIRLNSIFPGWMWGDTVEEYVNNLAQQSGRSAESICSEISRDIPIGYIPEDGECAQAVVALASDYFKAVTGACVDCSGGEYMPL